MRAITNYLRTHRSADIILLMFIVLVATRGWFNGELSRGQDAIWGMIFANTAKGTFLQFYDFSHWIGIDHTGSSLFCPLSPIDGLRLVMSFPFGWVVASKLLYLLFFALAGVFTYLYVYELTRNRLASFVSGLASIFLPYHLIEIAFAGHWDLGAGYMLAPLVFLTTERAIRQPNVGRIALAGIALALLTLTHPQILPILIGPFFLLYLVFRIWMSGKSRLVTNATVGLMILSLGLLLSAFWWLPLFWEIDYYQGTQFTLGEAELYKATFAQAITLRPSLECALSSAYQGSQSLLLSVVRVLPFVLVLLGTVLNWRNRYVWFFSAAALLTVVLAMGSNSPVDIYGFAHEHIPFFSRIRTPSRFLLFGGFAYAVLTGFCTTAMIGWLKRTRLRDLTRFGPAIVVVLAVSLIILGNTWQESRTAFGVIRLSPDQHNALSWLGEQAEGDYRIANPPFETYYSDPDMGMMVNPFYWEFLTRQESLSGSVLAQVKWTAEVLDMFRWRIKDGKTDIGSWLSLFNVKYVAIDKGDPYYSNVVLGKGLERVWTSNTIDIYENLSVKPRVFSVAMRNWRSVDLYSGDRINLGWADGVQPASLTLNCEHALSQGLCVKCLYQFLEPHGEFTNLGIDVDSIHFDEDDAIYLAFYSEADLPDIYLSLDVFERDGSRYGMDLGGVDRIKMGWNEVNLPVSLLLLRDSTDENEQLDFDEIETIWIGMGEARNSSSPHEFGLYFDRLSLVSHQVNCDVGYKKDEPWRYEVHVDSDSPSYLVLSESYHPDWVARYGDKDIQSYRIYEALNAFPLEAGQYDLTIEFVSSTPRSTGNIISSVAVIGLCVWGVVLLIHRRKAKLSRALEQQYDRQSGTVPTTRKE